MTIEELRIIENFIDQKNSSTHIYSMKMEEAQAFIKMQYEIYQCLMQPSYILNVNTPEMRQSKPKKGKTRNLQREIWEGWTAQDFIDALSDEINTIMTGMSWRRPFCTKKEMIDYIMNNQPFYKKPIPEVNEYFVELYGLK